MCSGRGGEAVWKDREEGRSARGKRGDTEAGSETTWPHSEDGRARLREASLVPTGLLVQGSVPWECLTNLAWKFQDTYSFIINYSL